MNILEEQLDFYKKKKAGCTFASLIAQNPNKYGWHQFILNNYSSNKIDSIINESIIDNHITTISIIFPTIKSNNEFIELIQILQKCEKIILEQDIVFENNRCLGFRVKINNDLSWISGFGNFMFLPKTRQSPYTEIVFRVKPRPNYDENMKEPIQGVIHLADMDMLGMSKENFQKLWNSSLKNTKKILGKSPNLHSAAKTTYSIPTKLFKL